MCRPVLSSCCNDKLHTLFITPPSFPTPTETQCFWLQMPGHQGKLQFASGNASDSVFGTHDPMRTANRVQEREEKCQACA